MKGKELCLLRRRGRSREDAPQGWHEGEVRAGEENGDTDA